MVSGGCKERVGRIKRDEDFFNEINFNKFLSNKLIFVSYELKTFSESFNGIMRHQLRKDLQTCLRLAKPSRNVDRTK